MVSPPSLLTAFTLSISIAVEGAVLPCNAYSHVENFVMIDRLRQRGQIVS